MKKLMKITLTTIAISIITTTISFAHSGRTDSSGGHKDKNNVSGLGSYHYHCGGHPAHLHPNGVCPYSSTQQTKENTSTQSSKSTQQTTKTQTKTQSNSTQTTTVTTSPEPAATQLPEQETTPTEPNTSQTTTPIPETNTTQQSEESYTESSQEESEQSSPSSDKSDDSSLLAGVAFLGIAGGGTYYCYKKYSKKK